jgi:eukaryotic-like serine/threonine-protein kinase
MRSEEWQRCVEIFSAALERQAEERAAFVDHACADDESLRREVTMLLRSHEESGDFISAPALMAAPELLGDERDALIGTHIGPYRVESMLGSGGMSVVYLAYDERLGRKVGLKLLPQSLIADMTHLSRLEREARAASALNHPNIVTIHDIGSDHSTHYIASELIEGETLRERLMRGPIQLSDAVDIATQVASALVAAHDAGVVHRDIKPENIMLRPDGYVKVLDFGIAKVAEQEMLAMTPTDDAVSVVETNLGSILGTARYMSPEQARGAPVDKRTDIWSLGVVFYEMATGHAPFTGDTPREVMSAILEKEPPPLTHYIAHTPAELQQIISKTLRKHREERYYSTHELLQALKTLRHKLEVAAELERSTAAPLWVRWIRSSAALVLVLLVSALALILPFDCHRNLTTTLPLEKSIAVLPFQNLSPDPQNAFFAEGVQEELLSNLTKIKDLKVISRTSVTQYKSGIKRNLKEIGQQLGVTKLVEGSVRRSGDHVRVSVQLIDVRSDRHLWGQTYDRTVADSLALQGDLATEITAAVGATLSPQEKARVVANPTNNPAAYDAYLRGRALVPGGWGYLHQEGDPDAAIRLLQEAVKLDPNFALAWAYLSIAELWSYLVGLDQSPARLAAVKSSLDRALALDPNLPEVHLALGYYEQDNTRSLAEFRQAEKGLPNSVDVIEAIALTQKYLGNWDAAIAELRRAIELDPRNVIASNNLALTYAEVRRFPEALATLDRVLAWAPTNARALVLKAEVFLGMGDLRSAEPLLENPEAPPALRTIYLMFQRRYAAAVEILSRALANPTDRDMRHPMVIIGLRLDLALSQQRAGDVSAARETYQKAVQDLQRQLEKVTPGSFHEANAHASLGLAYAGLGEAAAAIAEGQKAMAILPTSKDPEGGPAEEATMASIYALLGDADHAIPILKRLLQAPYGSTPSLTPATLRLDPIWDSIRNDPRFQDLATDKAP